MRTAFTVLVGLLAASSAFYFFRSLHKQTPLPKTTVAKFSLWKNQFRKLYATPQEDQYRLSVFASQVDTVDRLNEKYNLYLEKSGQPALQGPMFTLQEDSDLTTEEFTILKTGLQVPLEEFIQVDKLSKNSISAPPNSLSQFPYQYKIHNQGACGSCWAFSTVATLEKMYYDLNRVQVDLSQQYLVDCSTSDGGCHGGWPATTYKMVQENGMALGSAYPYIAAQGVCRAREMQLYNFGHHLESKFLNWSMEDAMLLTSEGVAPGVALYASGGFRYVSKNEDLFDPRGTGECGNYINHAVNLIGATPDYVIVLNSWGTGWGYNGIKKI